MIKFLTKHIIEIVSTGFRYEKINTFRLISETIFALNDPMIGR